MQAKNINPLRFRVKVSADTRDFHSYLAECSNPGDELVHLGRLGFAALKRGEAQLAGASEMPTSSASSVKEGAIVAHVAMAGPKVGADYAREIGFDASLLEPADELLTAN